MLVGLQQYWMIVVLVEDQKQVSQFGAHHYKIISSYSVITNEAPTAPFNKEISQFSSWTHKVG